MDEADKKLHGLDKILIMLGTNDCKAVFEKRKEEIPTNMDKLLKKIKAHDVYRKYKPQILVISPPLCGKDHIMLEKYYGSSKRVKWLSAKLEKAAELNDCKYIDIYADLAPQWSLLTKDSIHADEEGQIIILKMIAEQMK